MTNKNISRFATARAAAAKSDFKRGRVGCAVYSGNRLLATGCSSNKTHPLQHRLNALRDYVADGPSSADKVHAEIAALSKCTFADVDWANVEIYIYRLCSGKEHGMARPCAACAQAIRERGIRNVFYTTDDGIIHEKITKEL